MGIPFFRDLASRPRDVEKGTSLPPVLMVGMSKLIPRVVRNMAGVGLWSMLLDRD